MNRADDKNGNENENGQVCLNNDEKDARSDLKQVEDDKNLLR